MIALLILAAIVIGGIYLLAFLTTALPVLWLKFMYWFFGDSK